MRSLAILTTRATLVANPPAHYTYHDLSGNAVLLLARFPDRAAAIAWCQQPQTWVLRQSGTSVPAIAVTLLGPMFGVVGTDTMADALDKIASAWPHPWLDEVN